MRRSRDRRSSGENKRERVNDGAKNQSLERSTHLRFPATSAVNGSLCSPF